MTLSEFLSDRKMTTTEFAERIGSTQVSVYRYATGRRLPRGEHLQRITEATEGAVTANDFYAPTAPQPSSRPRKQKAEQGAAA